MPNVRGGPLAWRFSDADKDGPFSWSRLSDPDEFMSVLQKLHAFETMSENDIHQGGSHAVNLDQLSKEARDRLIDIQQDDLDELMSFRITARARIWCRMDENIKLVLWWDPDHKVCPSIKKHT